MTSSHFTRPTNPSIDEVANQTLDDVLKAQEGEDRAGALFIEQVAFAKCFLRPQVRARITAFFKSRS
ncbi:MAG: hypothetical protein ACKN9J_00135 [Holophagaceae bacterium]